MNLPTFARNAIASVLSLMAAGGLYLSIHTSEWYLLSVPLGLLVASAALVHRPTLGPQVLARAVWWANLALGVLLAATGNGRENTAGSVLGLACGGALLIAGRRALAQANAAGVKVPAVFRSMLLLLMIFALADAQAFLLFGSIGIIERTAKLGLPVVMLTIGAAYVVGFVGLYRLELWGAILNVVVSLAVLVLIATTRFVEKGELSTFLAILAIVHVVVAAPVVVAALRGKELPRLPPPVRALATSVVIAGLMLVCAVSWMKKGARW